MIQVLPSLSTIVQELFHHFLIINKWSLQMMNTCSIEFGCVPPNPCHHYQSFLTHNCLTLGDFSVKNSGTPPHAELKTWIEHSLFDQYQQSLMVLTQWEWRIIGEFASTWYLNACWSINSSMVSNFIILPCLGEECASREHECQIEENMEGVGSHISKTAH